MGCVCSCFGFENSEDNQEDRSIRSPSAFISYFLNEYAKILGTGQAGSIGCSAAPSTSSNVGLDGTVTVVSNTDDGFHPRCSNLQLGEGERTTILTHDQKGPHHHLLKDPEPLGPGGSNIHLAPLELVSELGTHNTSCCELSTAEVASRVIDYNYNSTSEHEDVCPTCLEEYAPENPKIVTQCSHHFHLGCIYEWLERSDTCPVCSKLMVFDETS